MLYSSSPPLCFFFVDKIGRRTLLFWGAVTMGFCHFVVGGTLGAHYEYVPGMSIFFILPIRVNLLTILRWRWWRRKRCHESNWFSGSHGHRF
jgi:hypothetical protein